MRNRIKRKKAISVHAKKTRGIASSARNKKEVSIPGRLATRLKHFAGSAPISCVLHMYAMHMRAGRVVSSRMFWPIESSRDWESVSARDTRWHTAARTMYTAVQYSALPGGGGGGNG